MSENQVTLALFAYNQERFVEAALDSVFAQTYRPFRLVVCDDASTDSTREKMERKLRGCPAGIEVVRAYAERNLGIGGIINLAAEHFQGEAVVLLAGDDVSEPTRVESAVGAISSGAGFHHTAVRKMDADGVFIEGVPVGQDCAYDVESFIAGTAPAVVGASCSYSREVFTFFAPLDRALMQEDVILPLRGLLLGGGRFTAAPLVRYRTHSGNLFSPSYAQSSTEMARRSLRFAPSRAAFCRQLAADLERMQVAGRPIPDSVRRWLKNESDYSTLEMELLSRPSWLGKACHLAAQVLPGRASFRHAAKVALVQLFPFLYGPAIRLWAAGRKTR